MKHWLPILLSLALGCEPNLTSIPNTTTRVGQAEVVDGTELELRIFTTLSECRARVQPDDIGLCMPYVDRANGEVRVGFQFRLDSDVFPLPLSTEHIKVGHLGRELQGGGANSVTIIPHDPMQAPQLFILLIDGSSSMAQAGRMEKVRKALLLPEVVEAFFPVDVKTGVVVFQFTDGKPRPLGGRLQVLETPRQFKRKIREMRPLSGYTHLYSAITYATGEFLERQDIQDLLTQFEMTPTVVALTDGFNNMARADTCGTNAKRLSTLLKHLETVRAPENGLDPRRRPSVYTVGLGKPLRAQFDLPRDASSSVSPRALCGRRFLNRRIDGDLETQGIDNASLDWIAKVGGGASYVRQDRNGLGKAFQGAAAARYHWFEARYRIHPYYLRRSFKTTLRLVSFATAEASVEIHPSAWLDAPPGVKGEGGWTERRPFQSIFVLLLPVLGLLFSLSYLGAATYHAKRAMFMRVRRPKGRKTPPL